MLELGQAVAGRSSTLYRLNAASCPFVSRSSRPPFPWLSPMSNACLSAREFLQHHLLLNSYGHDSLTHVQVKPGSSERLEWYLYIGGQRQPTILRFFQFCQCVGLHERGSWQVKLSKCLMQARKMRVQNHIRETTACAAHRMLRGYLQLVGKLIFADCQGAPDF